MDRRIEIALMIPSRQKDNAPANGSSLTQGQAALAHGFCPPGFLTLQSSYRPFSCAVETNLKQLLLMPPQPMKSDSMFKAQLRKIGFPQ
jgi:hypothetical protein